MAPWRPREEWYMRRLRKRLSVCYFFARYVPLKATDFNYYLFYASEKPRIRAGVHSLTGIYPERRIKVI